MQTQWTLGWSILLACLASGVFAQGASINGINGGGMSVGTVRGTAVAPVAPGATAEPIRMCALPGTRFPGDFYLLNTQSNRFGPFPYRDGTTLGAREAPHRLRVLEDNRFALQPPDGSPEEGPFTYASGTVLHLKAGRLVLVRAPSTIVGSMDLTGTLGIAPSVALGPMSDATQRALAVLRANLATVANGLAQSTSPVTFRDMPVIRGPDGRVRTPTVHRSTRDVENARTAAEARANSLLDAFARSHLPFQARVDATSGRFVFPALPAGNYIFCARLRVRDTQTTTTASSQTAIWWTALELGAHDRTELALSQANAVEWRGIFGFVH